MDSARPLIYRYWGKAQRSAQQKQDSELANDQIAGDKYHLLVYHCLDVAAVAARWWDENASLRHSFCHSNPTLSEAENRAWVLFFIALHDLGKFDLRFQSKSVVSWQGLNPEDQIERYPSGFGFDHGGAGLYWFREDFRTESDDDWFFDDDHPLEPCFPWVEAVTGHHGYVQQVDQLMADDPHLMPSLEMRGLSDRDKRAREQWINALVDLFLKPQGLSLQNSPPDISPLLAGFCSVSDWLGSWQTDDTFTFQAGVQDLQAYFQKKYDHDARLVLEWSGINGTCNAYQGVQALLDKKYQPRQLQKLVQDLPVENGLTLIEAPTGSGKTETALAYAWRLIDQGLADSIIFALPTQATANAMLERLDKLADILFDNPNLILAHGNSRFNEKFQAIKQKGQNPQGDEEAWAHCCDWLAQSRKRVFLGQIGVCTIDQVLVSVLPVKHRFVRGFGVGRSVLIVDELHAFDTYMTWLLKEVLQEQQKAGRSAILLSATLPGSHREDVLAAYAGASSSSAASIDEKNSIQDSVAPYPLISFCNHQSVKTFDLEDLPQDQPKPFSVSIETAVLQKLMPDESLIQRMIKEAASGAQVCLICNLVDDAQKVYDQLIKANDKDIEIKLFHARFTLTDRQAIETHAVKCFGPKGDRSQGRILVATQVVEQSLDVDFDWLITQLCPVDLLFQRLGRLHRHKRDARPTTFAKPIATVLLPDASDYGSHGLIYGNTAVLWRTQQKLEALAGAPLEFPKAYRDWIEPIYADAEEDISLPDWIRVGIEKFNESDAAKRRNARQMLKWAKEQAKPHKDNEETIQAVTRDGEMSIPVIPYVPSAQGKILLDGRILEQLSEYEQQEALVLNRVNVPESWHRKKCFVQEMDDKGLIWLEGALTDDVFSAKGQSSWQFSYTKETGLEREK